MSIGAGNSILAADFINDAARDATPANDTGRVVKLESDAKVARSFLRSAFGGTGADGALSVTSGTTTIDMANAKIFVKNYTSLSITGTGAVQFINPHSTGTMIIIKVRGNVTLTSSAAPMLDASSCGAQAIATTVSGVSSGDGGAGVAGVLGLWTAASAGGGNRTGGVVGAGGARLAPSTSYADLITSASIYPLVKYPDAFIGSSGGNGNASGQSANASISTRGGHGGGCLIIECGGAWNFTTASGISVAGGTAASSASGTTTQYGGSGGGGGGFFLALYQTLTANSGTVNSAAGTRSTGGGAGLPSGTSYGGGGAGSAAGVGSAGTSNGGTSGADGGAAAAGFSLIAANVDFA